MRKWLVGCGVLLLIVSSGWSAVGQEKPALSVTHITFDLPTPLAPCAEFAFSPDSRFLTSYTCNDQNLDVPVYGMSVNLPGHAVWEVKPSYRRPMLVRKSTSELIYATATEIYRQSFLKGSAPILVTTVSVLPPPAGNMVPLPCLTATDTPAATSAVKAFSSTVREMTLNGDETYLYYTTLAVISDGCTSPDLYDLHIVDLTTGAETVVLRPYHYAIRDQDLSGSCHLPITRSGYLWYMTERISPDGSPIIPAPRLNLCASDFQALKTADQLILRDRPSDTTFTVERYDAPTNTLTTIVTGTHPGTYPDIDALSWDEQWALIGIDGFAYARLNLIDGAMTQFTISRPAGHFLSLVGFDHTRMLYGFHRLLAPDNEPLMIHDIDTNTGSILFQDTNPAYTYRYIPNNALDAVLIERSVSTATGPCVVNYQYLSLDTQVVEPLWDFVAHNQGCGQQNAKFSPDDQTLIFSSQDANGIGLHALQFSQAPLWHTFTPLLFR